MKCATFKCRKQAAPGRRICHKCRSRKWREMHPVRAMFHKVKWSAKLRDIPFNLTFADFVLFDELNDYVARVGIAGESITIDRVKEYLGYSLDNIRVCPKSENVSKGNHFRAIQRKRAKLRGAA